MNIRDQVKADKACSIRAKIKPRWKYTTTYVEIILKIDARIVFKETRTASGFVQAMGSEMNKISSHPFCEVELRFFEA